MNNIRLSGTVAGRPSPINGGAGIRFHLRARHPPARRGLPPGIVHVPCTVFGPSPEQRGLLLEGKHGKAYVEATGRLEQIVSKGVGRRKNGRNNRRQCGGLEIIVNRAGLMLQRVI